MNSRASSTLPPSDVFRTICDWTKEYANAFLNGEGGTLCFGIEDTGVVTGVKLGRKERDDVQRRLGQIVKEFYPAVDPSLWQIEFAPILGTDDVPTIDLFVIELRISKGREDLYWPSAAAGSAPYIRLPGGINRMPPSMIEQRIKRGRISTAAEEKETAAEDSSAGTETTDKTTNRLVDSLGCEYIIVRRPSVTFTCQLPVVFGRGDDLRDAGGEIEIHTAEYRRIRVSLRSEDIRGNLMRGLSTPLSWHARPYLRQVDAELYEVLIGDTTMRLRNREVRHLCQCIDHVVSIYKQDLIQTEDALETWEYGIFERKDFIGVCLLQVPLELWRLMHGFSQEFISPGNSEWHIFEPTQHAIRVGRDRSEHADIWPLSPQSVYSWDAVGTSEFVILVRHLSDSYLPLTYARSEFSRRGWIHSVGEAGIWRAEWTKHWLLTKFIPKVMEHNGDRITSEARSALSKKIFDLRLHRLSPAGSNDAEQLSDRVVAIQSWSSGSFNPIRRELILPYYESLLILATQSKRATLDYAYIGGYLEEALRSLTQGASASRRARQWMTFSINSVFM